MLQIAPHFCYKLHYLSFCTLLGVMTDGVGDSMACICILVFLCVGVIFRVVGAMVLVAPIIAWPVFVFFVFLYFCVLVYYLGW